MRNVKIVYSITYQLSFVHTKFKRHYFYNIRIQTHCEDINQQSWKIILDVYLGMPNTPCKCVC